MDLVSIGVGLGVGLACLGVAIGQGFFLHKVMDVFGKNPKMTNFFLIISILGIALVESSSIYGLIVALKTLSTNFVHPFASIGTGLAIGLTGLGVGIGEGMIVNSSVNAINKNPDEKNKIMSYMILFIALIESSSIYGLIVAFEIILKLEIDPLVSLSSGLSIGLTGLGVGIGEGMIAKKSMDVIGDIGLSENKMIVPFTILGIALIESVAIYGLIASMSILKLGEGSGLLAVGASLAVGLSGLGVALGEGILISKSISNIGIHRLSGKNLIPVTVLGVALVESAAIYGLVVAFQIIGASVNIGLNAVGAGLAIGLTGLGVGLGEGYVGRMAMETFSINRVSKTRITTYMVLFIAMVESIAIYGFIVSIKILGLDIDLSLGAIGAGLAIGLAGAGVAVGEALLSGKSLNIIGKRPTLTGFFVTITILGIALVESSVIYGLIVSFQIISKEIINFIAIGAGLAIGIAGLGVGLSEGFLISGAFSSIARNPEFKTKFLTFMILFVSLVEVLSIYGLIVSFQLLK